MGGGISFSLFPQVQWEEVTYISVSSLQTYIYIKYAICIYIYIKHASSQPQHC